MRLLIIGAAGSGTTSLGQAGAAAIGISCLDSDDYFWLPTRPPYQHKRGASERLSLLLSDLSKRQDCVLSGSIVSWGKELEDSFSLIVFLTVDAATRVARLLDRETARFEKADDNFIEWAAQYDECRLPGRSRHIHEEWLSTRTCPILRIAGDVPIVQSVDLVRSALSNFKCSGLPSAAAD